MVRTRAPFPIASGGFSRKNQDLARFLFDSIRSILCNMNRSRIWRRLKQLAVGFLAFSAALVLAVLILEYSQPVWELRVEGPPGTKFDGCVTVYPWWGLGDYAIEGYSPGLEVPYVESHRTMRMHPYVTKEQGPGPLRVTLLRNGVVVESREADRAFGSPALF